MPIFEGGGKRRKLSRDGSPTAARSPASSVQMALASRRQQLEPERHKLPAWAAKDKLLELVKAHHTLVVVGETGSGKTTQIPAFLLHAGFARGGAIACTQPRRVAAMTVARRVAEEMGVALGEQVGYSIRFDDMTSQSTRIKYLTDGLLLREALLDPELKQYKVVVIDEAHERTVHTDVLLGLLKGVQAKRGDDFRLIIMSATLDAAKFVQYFAGAKAAYIQGRQFPVQVMYTATPEDSYMDAALTAALQVHTDEGPGDILIFLTGQEEIESLQGLLQAKAAQLQLLSRGSADVASESSRPAQLMVVAIYSAMPPEQQLKVFEPAPPGTRKAILATNIAETSITIPGVRYVIDPGVVKSRGYNAHVGAESLQVVEVSQAQARQRSGRAGREAPGKAFRLFTEATFDTLQPTTLPEILRTNLDNVVLQLKALGIDDVLGFDFLDPPPKAAIIRSLELLYSLGALDGQGKLTTPVGHHMARLPVDPMYSKVLLASTSMGCSNEAMQVVAVISAENVFVSPRNKREESNAARLKFTHRDGDHLTLLTVLRSYLELPHSSQARWCSDNFVNLRAMRKAADILQQLQRHMAGLGLPSSTCGEDLTPLRRALTAGLFPNAARRMPDNSYRVINTGQSIFIHPGSVLCGKKPDCMVFNELVKTTKQYAHDLCAIDPRWLPELAPAFFAAKASVATAAPHASN